MIHILEFVLNLIYPGRCGFCNKINMNYLCEECEQRLQEILMYKIKNFQNKYFDKSIYIASYEGEIREKILEYKFSDKSYLYKTFSKLILKNKKICKIIRKV